MCGIAGFCGPADGERLQRLGAALAHRGPDDAGFFVSDGISLAHRRLSILDISPSGRQPFVDEDAQVAVIVNGEFYNFQTLRAELETRGAVFHSHSDSEVLLHGFLAHGSAFFSRLEGMFAFAVWDGKTKELFLGRDAMGIKPLYYCTAPTGVTFASEINALLESGSVDFAVDPQHYFEFLTLMYVPAPHTAIRGVHKILPGTFLKIRWDGAGWDLRPPENFARTDRAAETGNLEEILDQAIQSHLVSDVPVGVLLSGGLDSSLVTAKAARFSERPLHTFSAAFGERDDETQFARLVAAKAGTIHHEHLLQPRDVAAVLDEVLWHMDEPLADAGAIPTYLLSREVREHVKVVLVGEGADELFGGYHWHYLEHPLFSAIPRAWRDRAYFYLNSFTSPRPFFSAEGQRLRSRARQGMLDGLATHAEQSPIQRYEFARLLPDSLLMKVDKMTMAHGLEARVPFLDQRLVAAVTALPPEKRLHWGRRKHLLKDLAARELPPEILQRRKHGFLAPTQRWLKTDLRDRLNDVLHSGEAFGKPFFQANQLAQLLEPTRWPHQRIERSSLIWRIFIFENWYRQRKNLVLDNRAPSASPPMVLPVQRAFNTPASFGKEILQCT